MKSALPTPSKPLSIGTRGSPLALAQARETRERLCDAFDLPPTAFNIVVITTTGDRIVDRPLRDIGGKGLFTREIENALLDGSIDIAVHSMKDMPTQQPKTLLLDTYLPREDVRDALISSHASAPSELVQGAVVGTSSLRRKAQLMSQRPDLRVVEFRGNLQTRLNKLASGVADATLLAMAGLNRLGMTNVPRTAIDVGTMLPAIAQGAIGVERRDKDTATGDMLAAIHHVSTGHRLAAERAFLTGLDGSCETPIAGLAELVDGQLRLRGQILRPDGSEMFYDDSTISVDDGPEAGREMARKLLESAGPDFFD